MIILFHFVFEYLRLLFFAVQLFASQSSCIFDRRHRTIQEKIHPFFYRRGPIVNVLPKIRAVGSDDGIVDLIPPFAPIHCLRTGEW